VNKILAHLRDIAYPLPGRGYADHGFGGMHRYRGYLLILRYKIVEQLAGVGRLALKKIFRVLGCLSSFPGGHTANNIENL
jgi:hypothetical protein